MTEKAKELLYGTVEVHQNEFRVLLNFHHIHRLGAGDRGERQTLHQQVIAKQFNTCASGCPIQLVLSVDSDETFTMLDWDVRSSRGNKVTIRFDYLAPAYNPVRFCFGPARVRFNHWCCDTKPGSYERRKRNLYDADRLL